MSGLKDGKTYKFEKELKVKYVDYSDLDYNGEVMEQYFRVKAAEVMEKAGKLADQEKYSEASESLMALIGEIKKAPSTTDFLKNVIKDLE